MLRLNVRDMIVNKEQLQDFMEQHRLRLDWHEPDNQNVSARVTGLHLDNAMGADPSRSDEMIVVLEVIKDGIRMEAKYINLANLLAWASDSGIGSRNITEERYRELREAEEDRQTMIEDAAGASI